jgi:two-component system response regulator AtoC
LSKSIALPFLRAIESELFGYEKAFTGAVTRKPGKFEFANHGTIFLDEISEMHPSLQAKLLHVLQDNEFSRLGGDEDVSVDVRVITATNRQIEKELQNGNFREDLYYRINVVSIHLPPLRERMEDLLTADFFLRKYADTLTKYVPLAKYLGVPVLSLAR